MKEHGLYIVKHDFLVLIQSLGGDVDIRHGDKRPVYCCLKDAIIDGLFWAIPTSDIDHRSTDQISKYQHFINLPENDLRSCYYHFGRTTKDAIYKISSCYPIIEKYIDHEFKSCGQHIIIKRAETVNGIERKLKRILAMESRKPNYFPQHITDIKNALIQELNNTQTIT